MNKLFLLSMLSLICTAKTAFSCSQLLQNNEENNIKLLKEQYSEFLEKKNINLMSKYIAKEVTFQRNFAPSEDYMQLYQHVINQNEKCIQLKILPFDDVIAASNKVVTSYTWRCIDANNIEYSKRIISIAEFNDQGLIVNMRQVSYDKAEK